MNLPPLHELRELPVEVRELILEQLVQEAPEDLCGRLYERCLLLLGSGNCGAENPIWRQACERFGLRRMAIKDTTWRETFELLCRDLARLRQREYEEFSARANARFARQRDVATRSSLNMGRYAVARQTFFAHLRGGGVHVDLEEVRDTFATCSGNQPFYILGEALEGLGAIDVSVPRYQRVLENALAQGGVDAVKAALGVGIHPGGLMLFNTVKGMESEHIPVPYWSDDTTAAEYRAGRQKRILQKIRLLLRAGASPNGVVDGRTAFLLAAANFEDPLRTHNECFRLLLEGGADPNYGPWHGTPLVRLLHPATKAHCQRTQNKIEFLERLRLLLEAGADPNAAHRLGTPMALLRSWRSWGRVDARQEAEELLKAYGATG